MPLDRQPFKNVSQYQIQCVAQYNTIQCDVIQYDTM